MSAGNTARWGPGANAPGSGTTLLSSGLNSLANNTASAASSTYDNQTTPDLYANLILHLASLSPVVPAYVTIYILVSTDGGTTFPSATGSVLRNQPSAVLGAFQLDTTATTAQDLVLRGIVLPPNKFQVVLDNQSGVALNASGNSLKMETYNVNLNG